MPMVQVEIVVIGNEILLGQVQDTNTGYLCRVVRGMGGRVRHAATVRDEIAGIAEEIKASLARRADLVFTCGGLGPTDDDVTLAAVAEAVGVNLILHPAARDFVERKYRELAAAGHVAGAEMTEARLKMAHLPAGAGMVENPVGAAPAAVVEIENSRIISLPGVPAELKGIIAGPLQPLLQEVFGRGAYREREIIVECGDESALAPALRQVAAAHPEVYVKSRPSHFGPDVKFRILLSTSADSPERAEEIISRASDDLARALRDEGV